LHNPSDHTLQAEFALHRHETDAILSVLNNWLVIDGLITQIEIARSIVVPILAEGAG
jgi:hypothetical protein